MIPRVATQPVRLSAIEVSVNAFKKREELFLFDRIWQNFRVSSVCMRVHTLVYLFVCFSCFFFFTCVHAPRGETGCVGCYLLLQRVTANHQPWQTLGEKGRGERGRQTREGGWLGGETEGEGRGEMALGRGIGIWIPPRIRSVLRILSLQPLFEFRPELDNRAASHLTHWQLINPHRCGPTARREAADKALRQFLMSKSLRLQSLSAAA